MVVVAVDVMVVSSKITGVMGVNGVKIYKKSKYNHDVSGQDEELLKGANWVEDHFSNL